MLARQEYHNLKAASAWLQKVLKVQGEAQQAADEAFKEHKGCGAMNVVDAFGPATMMATVALKQSIELLIEIDDDVDPVNGPTEDHVNDFEIVISNLYSEWIAVIMAIEGMTSAWKHIGVKYDSLIKKPPIAVEEGEDRPVILLESQFQVHDCNIKNPN